MLKSTKGLTSGQAVRLSGLGSRAGFGDSI